MSSLSVLYPIHKDHRENCEKLCQSIWQYINPTESTDSRRNFTQSRKIYTAYNTKSITHLHRFDFSKF